MENPKTYPKEIDICKYCGKAAEDNCRCAEDYKGTFFEVI